MKNSLTDKGDFKKFHESKEAIKIHSGILNDNIWLVQDEKSKNRLIKDQDLLFDDTEIYTMREMEYLIKMDNNSKKIIHTLKRNFVGVKVESQDLINEEK